MAKQQTEKDDHPRTVTEKGKPFEPLSDRTHEIRRQPGQPLPDATQDKGNEHDHVGSSHGGSTSRQEPLQDTLHKPDIRGEQDKTAPDDEADDEDAKPAASRDGIKLSDLRRQGWLYDTKTADEA
ncbi:MAG: hypothetical protein H7X77_01585 [Anaerolineae bacterium]|nr:hypothetical protein [Anaerolineae bacterium]